MNSIPLIKGNTPQEINTSIISLKKALAALEAQDKQLQGNGNDVQNKIKQINELIKGINSHLETIDGQITTAIENITEIASSLPTDAVLHYSFDELPDYPDGTADTRYINGNTYNIPVIANGEITTASFSLDNKVHKSNINGNANYKSDISITTSRGIYFSLIDYARKLVILDVIVKTSNMKIQIEVEQTEGSSQTLEYPLGTNVPIGRYRIALLIPNYYKYTLCFYGKSSTSISYTEWELTGYYVGNGSYTTPVIDNANGQNNGTNNGGIATKGVSGKGAYLIAGKSILVGGSLNLQDKFSFSFWYNPSNTTTGINGTIINSNMIAIRNGMSWNSTLTVIIFYSDNTNTAIYTINLPANTWSHIVCIKDGLQVSIYINGVKVKSGTLVNKALRALGSTLSIGLTNCERNQSVDDLLIFNRALSETEVKALYLNRANTPKYYSWADWKLN